LLQNRTSRQTDCLWDIQKHVKSIKILVGNIIVSFLKNNTTLTVQIEILCLDNY